MQTKKINEIKANIQQLLTFSQQVQETYKTRTNFLFKQLERIENIQNFGENKQLIEAYLIIQSYKYKEGMNEIKLLERIGLEVEKVQENINKENKIRRELVEIENDIEKMKKDWKLCDGNISNCQKATDIDGKVVDHSHKITFFLPEKLPFEDLEQLKKHFPNEELEFRKKC